MLLSSSVFLVQVHGVVGLDGLFGPTVVFPVGPPGRRHKKDGAEGVLQLFTFHRQKRLPGFHQDDLVDGGQYQANQAGDGARRGFLVVHKGITSILTKQVHTTTQTA